MILEKIKKELRVLGIRPRKSLGQNFLINEGVYKKIIAALETKRDDIIIEVGPGLGTLTEYLAESGAKIIAVEKDREFVAYLKNKFAGTKNVTIREGDILKFEPESYQLSAKSYKLTGNIPYYLTSRLLRVILEKWSRLSNNRGSSTRSGPEPKLVVLMLQKEVAQRIAAQPPDMSLLAVSVQYYAEPKIIDYVSAGSFYPPPKVDSAIIKLVISDRFPVSSKKTRNSQLEASNFFKIVRAGFKGKRKQLINNLSTGLKLPKKEVESKLFTIGINPKRRAETLTIEEWQRVTNILSLQR